MNMHTFVTLTEEEVDKDDRVTNNGMSWNIRNRFVELDLLAKNMFCCMCNVPLHLQDTVSERVCGGEGVRSHLCIGCSNLDCQTITDVLVLLALQIR